MRIACYARVSTEEQSLHGLSIDAQLAALREYAGGQSVGEYVDAGISGRIPIKKRPELQRLLRDVEQGRIDLVLFTKLDRWTRDVREYFKAQDILDAHNVAWKAIQEDYETETSTGKFKVNVMLAVAQQEAERTSERVKAVFEDKRRRGLVASGSAPLGVKIENGKLVPGDDAQVVLDLFNAYISTRSIIDVARRCGMSAAGARYLLTNKNYLDLGIIDRQTWETVQSIREQRGQRRVRTDRVYLFSGLLVCPYCGHRLSSADCHGSVYYRCPRRYVDQCPGTHLKEEAVEDYLLSKVMQSVKERNVAITKKAKKPVNVQALKKKRDKLTDLFMDDLIDKDKYSVEFKQLTAQIEKAENEPKPVDVTEIKSALEAYKGLTRAGKKAFWSSLVKSITPTENGFDFTLNYT